MNHDMVVVLEFTNNGAMDKNIDGEKGDLLKIAS